MIHDLIVTVRSLLHPHTLAWFIPAAICYLTVSFTEAHQHIEQQILMVKRETAQRLDPNARRPRPCDRTHGQVTNVCVAEGCYGEACLRLAKDNDQ